MGQLIFLTGLALPLLHGANVAAPSYGANAGIWAAQGAAATDAIEGKASFAATAMSANVAAPSYGAKKIKKKLKKSF